MAKPTKEPNSKGNNKSKGKYGTRYRLTVYLLPPQQATQDDKIHIKGWPNQRPEKQFEQLWHFLTNRWHTPFYRSYIYEHTEAYDGPVVVGFLADKTPFVEGNCYAEHREVIIKAFGGMPSNTKAPTATPFTP